MIIYDGNNNLNSVKDANENTTSYENDSSGNVVDITDAEGNEFKYSYDANGNVIQVSSYNYDENYSYDHYGNMTSSEKNGSITSYKYDENNNMVNKYSETDQVTYGYDEFNKVTSTAYEHSNTKISYEHDLAKQVDQDGYIIKYDYDELGRVTMLTYPNNQKAHYTYYKSNRIDSVCGNMTCYYYEYNMLDQVTNVTSTNGLNTTITYDLKGQVTSVVNKVWTNTVSEYSYVYDARGNMIESYDNGIKSSYTYDANNQITEYETANKVEEYTYDKIGNRTSKTVNGEKTIYNYVNDLLVSTTGAEENKYMYDESGNLTQVLDEDGITSLSYNQFNQLVGIEQSNGSSMVLMYDGFGNLINTTQTVRNYDLEALNELLDDISPDDLAEFKTVNIEQYTGEYNNTYLHQVIKTLSLSDYSYEEVKTYKPEVMSYTYVNDITKQHPDILVKIDNVLLTSENTIYGYDQLQSGELNYQYDGLGNITTYTANNDTQTVTYDPFGNTDSDVTNEFGYNSEYNVTEDLQYLRARYYNPETARFITQDTVYGNVEDALSQNRYTYCGNNPIKYDDPSGNIFGSWALNSASLASITVRVKNDIENFIEGEITLYELSTELATEIVNIAFTVIPGLSIFKLSDPTKLISSATSLIYNLMLTYMEDEGLIISAKENEEVNEVSVPVSKTTGSSNSNSSIEDDVSSVDVMKPKPQFCTEVYYVAYIDYTYSGENGMRYV